jgi:hypothetical protein
MVQLSYLGGRLKNSKLFSILLCVSILLTSCNLPTSQTPTVASAEGVMTAVAQTVAANSLGTQIAAGTNPALPVQNTVQPSVPVVVQSPTPQTPTVTPTTTPTVTATSIPCDRAAFVTDVTVPDGTAYLPNVEFTKTWRLQNNGSCTWNTSYALVFDTGDAMNGPTAVNLTGSVGPGQTIDVSVNLKAPASVGTYKGFWRLRNASNAVFGIGANASTSFWVEIKVQLLQITLNLMPVIPMFLLPRYDLATRACDAEWRSAAGALACPGSTGDNSGFVVRVDNPTLQDGVALSGVALETHPQWTDAGVISGKYPAFTIESGDHFKAKIGCLNGGGGCNVEMQLNYRDGSGLHNLAKWNMAYADAPKDVDVDLSALNGQSIQIVLAVSANGSAGQDWAVWYWPRITK